MIRIEALYINTVWQTDGVRSCEIKVKREQNGRKYTSTDNIIVMLYKNQWKNIIEKN